MTIRTARPAAAVAVDPCEVRVIVEQLVGPACRGTLDAALQSPLADPDENAGKAPRGPGSSRSTPPLSE